MDIKNVKFISAGAGSGKTYTLTEELYRKISDKTYKPSEILLTTFTNAAADEFKERARAKLIEKGCLEEADQLAEATIGTVHSVCLSFLKKYWYRNGGAVVPREITDNERDAYISRSLLDVVTEDDIDQFNRFRDEFDIRDRNFQKDYGWWKTYLTNIINESATFGVEDFSNSMNKSDELIDEIFSSDKKEISDSEWRTLSEYLDLCKNSAVAKARNHIQPLEKIIGNGRHRLRYCDIVKLYDIAKDPGDKRSLKKNPTLYESVNLLQDSFSELLSSARYGSLVKDITKRLFTLAEKWKKAYSDYKKKNGLIDYNDMEHQFLMLLDDKNIVEEIRSSVRLVMVDEFQDCNQTQVRIFEKLSGIAEESIWVGDPKQAIYGFRGSDTELTNAVTDIFSKIPEGKTVNGLEFGKLGKSYRSTPEIVDFVNELYASTFGRYGLDEDLVRLDCSRKDEHGKVRCWKVIGGNADERACRIAAKIKNSIDSEGQRPGDIAILVRKNSDYGSYANALVRLGIPINTGAEHLSDYAEVQMLASVLKYVLNSRNALAKAENMRLLTDRSSGEIITDRIRWISGIGEEEESLESNTWIPDEKLFAKLDFVAAQVKTLSVSEAVKGIIALLSLKRKCERWGNAAARKARLDRVVAMAKEYEDSCLKNGRGASMNGFLTLLTNVNLNDDSTDVSSDAEGVTICTYHKSKGLQWNTVIMDGLCDDSYKIQTLVDHNIIGIHAVRDGQPDSENPYVAYSIVCLPKFMDKDLTEKMTRALSEKIDKVREKTMKENNRLYYVGMTRAKDNLIILMSGRSDKTDFISINPLIPETGQPLLGRLGASVEELPEADIAEEDMKYQKMTDCLGIESESGNEKYVSPSRFTGQFDQASAKTSLIWKTGHLEKNRHLIELTDVKDDEKMAGAGTCIHNIFAAFRPEVSDDENNAMAERVVSLSSMSNCFRNVPQVICSAKAAYTYLESTFDKGKALKEVPFSMEENGYICSGEIDLVWDLGEGRCVLVDFKSYPGFDLEPHALEYAGQLALYRKALEKAGYTLVASPLIYFSTHGAFVEVRV